jgi:hypothetical protein
MSCPTDSSPLGSRLSSDFVFRYYWTSSCVIHIMVYAATDFIIVTKFADSFERRILEQSDCLVPYFVIFIVDPIGPRVSSTTSVWQPIFVKLR